MKKIAFISLLLTIYVFTFAQDPLGTVTYRNGSFSLVPLPIIGANPTNGWLFGVAPAATWYMGDTGNTSLSSMLGSVIYTTNEQLITTAKANTYFAGDRWNMLTDIRFFVSSQPTYGLGTGPQSAKPIAQGDLELNDNPYTPIETSQMMAFSFFRLHNTLMKRYQDSRFYAGVGYHLDYHFGIKDNMLNLDTIPQQKTSHYWYSELQGFNPEHYVLSGLSLNLLYDSRDNAVNPYSGRMAFANLHVNPTFLGSSQNSTVLWLEYRDYIHLSKERPRHLIGFWTYGSFVTSGKVPYMDLPAVGWDQFGRSGRAYTQGRFRGIDIVYGEVEYRFPLQKKSEIFGGVIFANGTTASNRNDIEDYADSKIKLFEYIDYAYGAGLRIMIDKKSRANLSIDYAIGKYGSQGFYLGINEVF